MRNIQITDSGNYVVDVRNGGEIKPEGSYPAIKTYIVIYDLEHGSKAVFELEDGRQIAEMIQNLDKL